MELPIGMGKNVQGGAPHQRKMLPNWSLRKKLLLWLVWSGFLVIIGAAEPRVDDKRATTEKEDEDDTAEKNNDALN